MSEYTWPIIALVGWGVAGFYWSRAIALSRGIDEIATKVNELRDATAGLPKLR